ncbi:hypothetical protein [Streptomyces sp. NPDC002490]|uniref:hypothetical protein n=1 Tax=Streptomyces sp. NPDC002490 TaxID=3154416 RepID=UPI0033271500
MPHPRTPSPRHPGDLLTRIASVLLLALTLCVLAHVPVDEHHGAGPLATAPANGGHHPGGHHEGEECGTDQTPRLPSNTVEPAPPGGPLTYAVVLATPHSSPARVHTVARSAPDRRTGRAALVRTSRWRI